MYFLLRCYTSNWIKSLLASNATLADLSSYLSPTSPFKPNNTTDTDGIAYTYTIKSSDDVTGQLVLEATATKGSLLAKKDFVISSFATTTV